MRQKSMLANVCLGVQATRNLAPIRSRAMDIRGGVRLNWPRAVNNVMQQP